MTLLQQGQYRIFRIIVRLNECDLTFTNYRMHASSQSAMIASNDFIAAADIVIIITIPICTDYGWSGPVVKFILNAQACLHLKQ